MNVITTVVFYTTMIFSPSLMGEAGSPPTDGDRLTLLQAIERALTRNPELKAGAQGIQAVKAARRQAGMRPNPELELETENFGGAGLNSGFDSAETTVLLGHRLEMAGKRTKRGRIADHAVDLAKQRFAAKRLDIITGTRLAFVEVLAAQERVVLEHELLQLAREMEVSVVGRVEAGKVSSLEGIKANVAVANAQARWQLARQTLTAKKIVLSGFWGSDQPAFSRVAGVLDQKRDLPSKESLARGLSRNPNIAFRALSIQRETAIRNLEKANRFPDLTLKGGYRRFNENNSGAWVVGVSLPIPLFNRNQGAIQMAGFRIGQAGNQLRAAKVEARVDLAEDYQSLLSFQQRITVLKNRVLPAAERAFEGMREGYREGKFGYLDVLDAQRTFFEAKLQLNELLAQYQQQWINLDRLLGKGFNTEESQKEANHE